MKSLYTITVLCMAAGIQAAAPTGWTCFAAGEDVMKASVGGDPQTVLSDASAKHCCWSADGSLIFFITGSGDIYAVDHTGTNKRKIGTADDKKYRAIAAYRPEPTSVLCVKNRTFYKINATTNGGLEKIADADCAIEGEIAISADGKRLAWRSSGMSKKLRKMVVGQSSSTGYASNCSADISPNGTFLLENISGHTELDIYNWTGGKTGVEAGDIGHWDNQSFAVNSDTWICALDDDTTLNDNKGTGVGIVSRGNEAYMVTSWSGSATMYPSFFVGDLPDATDPPDPATRIISPPPGSKLTMGSTIILKGEGKTLTWSYDADSDKKGEIAIGSGPEVSFSVPTDVTSPLLLTLTLVGADGTVQETYQLLDSETATIASIPHVNMKTHQIVSIFALDGSLLAHGKACRSFVSNSLQHEYHVQETFLVQFTDGRVHKMVGFNGGLR